jgi:DNA ligase-1
MLNDTDLMHGVHWSGQDLGGMLLSEKFNGCRAAWDGARMWSRAGIEVRIPDAWRAQLPAMPLDGEIYAGRNNLIDATLATTCSRFKPFVRFMVFDTMMSATLPQRERAITEALAACRIARPVRRTVCESTQHAMEVLEHIRSRHGEGIMAQDPAVPYQPGRSQHILKIKTPHPRLSATPRGMAGYRISALL